MSAESPDEGEQQESAAKNEKRILRAVRSEWIAGIDNPEVSRVTAFFWNHVVTSVCSAFPDVTGAEVYRIIHQIDDGEVSLEDDEG